MVKLGTININCVWITWVQEKEVRRWLMTILTSSLHLHQTTLCHKCRSRTLPLCASGRNAALLLVSWRLFVALGIVIYCYTSMPVSKYLTNGECNCESKLTMLLWTLCPVYVCIMSRSYLLFDFLYLKIIINACENKIDQLIYSLENGMYVSWAVKMKFISNLFNLYQHMIPSYINRDFTTKLHTAHVVFINMCNTTQLLVGLFFPAASFHSQLPTASFPVKVKFLLYGLDFEKFKSVRLLVFKIME